MEIGLGEIPYIYSEVFFFTQRVINVWNSLPGHIVEAEEETLGVFKTRLNMVLGTFR